MGFSMINMVFEVMQIVSYRLRYVTFSNILDLGAYMSSIVMVLGVVVHGRTHLLSHVTRLAVPCLHHVMTRRVKRLGEQLGMSINLFLSLLGFQMRLA